MTTDGLVRAVENRLKARWVNDLTSPTPTDSWPHRFPTGLGSVTQEDLQNRWDDIYRPAMLTWRSWATDHHLTIIEKPRRVWSLLQDLPTHIEVQTIDEAAHLVGNDWPTRLARTRDRICTISDRYPACDLPATVRAVHDYPDVDFDLLLTVADWYLTDPTRATVGVTPRQVPLPGVHAKWLQHHTAGVLALTGLPSLGLLPRHPARVHFTYLDPAHRAAGGRWHDSATVGDYFAPAYQPTVVLISENKDTAIHFPPVPGGISVEGAGYGGTTIAAFPWLTNAPALFYWGDIDAHGYEILNGYRNDGVPVSSILMDQSTFDTYAKFGTDHDQNNTLLAAQPRKPLPHLTDRERVVYDRLTDPTWRGVHRIEQERIPLDVAHTTLASALTGHMAAL